MLNRPEHVRRTELTCTILLHVVMLSRVSELTELVLMLFLILSWGRGLDERSKLSLKILVIPNRNLTHTMLQPEKLGVTVPVSRREFTFPTGPAKPEESGSGIPVRFGRLPVGTGQIQI